VQFSAEIEPLATEAAKLLGESQAADDLREAYRAGDNYGSAFGKLFARIFRDHELIFLNPLDPELHRIAAPVYAQALQESESIDRELLARGRKLRDAGYHEQVKVTAFVFAGKWRAHGDSPRQRRLPNRHTASHA
jgi:hypothetical protein